MAEQDINEVESERKGSLIMVTRATLYPLCMLLLMSGSAYGEEAVIEGAFGYHFGQVLETEGREPAYRGEGGIRAYTVDRPPRPYQALSRYTVHVTAGDRIYEIAGDGRVDSRDACLDELEFVSEVVLDRYADVVRLESRDELIARTVLRQGSRLVEIVCLDEAFAVRYSDDSVLASSGISSARERQEAPPSDDRRNRDTSGL